MKRLQMCPTRCAVSIVVTPVYTDKLQVKVLRLRLLKSQHEDGFHRFHHRILKLQNFIGCCGTCNAHKLHSPLALSFPFNIYLCRKAGAFQSLLLCSVRYCATFHRCFWLGTAAQAESSRLNERPWHVLYSTLWGRNIKVLCRSVRFTALELNCIYRLESGGQTWLPGLLPELVGESFVRCYCHCNVVLG